MVVFHRPDRRIGEVGETHTLSAVLGSGLTLFLCFVEAALMTSELRLISQEPNFGVFDVVVYTLAYALLLGGGISSVFAARAALKRT